MLLTEKTKELSEKTLLLESCRQQLSEQQEILTNKETALSDFKSMVEKIKTSHEDELKVQYNYQDKNLVCSAFHILNFKKNKIIEWRAFFQM